MRTVLIKKLIEGEEVDVYEGVLATYLTRTLKHTVVYWAMVKDVVDHRQTPISDHIWLSMEKRQFLQLCKLRPIPGDTLAFRARIYKYNRVNGENQGEDYGLSPVGNFVVAQRCRPNI